MHLYCNVQEYTRYLPNLPCLVKHQKHYYMELLIACEKALWTDKKKTNNNWTLHLQLWRVTCDVWRVTVKIMCLHEPCLFLYCLNNEIVSAVGLKKISVEKFCFKALLCRKCKVVCFYSPNKMLRFFEEILSFIEINTNVVENEMLINTFFLSLYERLFVMLFKQKQRKKYVFRILE